MEEYEDYVKAEVSSLNIAILINNVGMTYEAPALFHEVAQIPGFTQKMINLNIGAVSSMTKLILPGMLLKNKGAIINVGSIASLYGLPYYAMYAATKSFIESLTLDMELEYRHTGILFQYQAPGYVTTKISKRSKASLFVPSPEQFARAGLNSVGLLQCSPVWLPQRAIHFYAKVLASISPHYCRRMWVVAVYPFWLFVKKREMQKKTKNCNGLSIV
jgi:17beta-estradiol 17-dehydrogenase / very-long-chain 3-oxoacyl-CoA reductase